LVLVWTLAGTIAATLILTAATGRLGLDPTHLLSILQLIFAPVVTLVSTVLGFYFGSDAQRTADQAASSQGPDPTHPEGV
jgi:hypothetical protein